MQRKYSCICIRCAIREGSIYRRKVMSDICSAYFGVLTGLLCYSMVAATESAHDGDELIVVVESTEWLNATKQLVGDNAEVLCWKFDRPDWFQCDTTTCQKILVLSDPNNQQMSKELWRERLHNQGCHIYPIKLGKSSESSNQSNLLRTLHRSLVDCHPEKESIWDKNFQQALSKLHNSRAVAHFSSKYLANKERGLDNEIEPSK